MKIALSGGIICTFNEKRDVFLEGVLGINNDRISFVGTKLPSDFHPDLRIDCSGCIILPGLVNAHIHLGEYLFKGLMDEINFQNIFFSRLFSWEACLEPELVYWGSLAAAVEALRCGVTTVGDIYHHAEATARAVEASGIRASIGQLIYGFPLQQPFKANAYSFNFDFAAFKDQLAKAREFAERWNGKAEGRITTAIAPHATNTLTPQMLEHIAEVVENNPWLIHTHLAQMKSEYDMVVKQYKLGCVELLYKTGILKHKFLGAHAIFLKHSERKLLGNVCAGIAHNPIANAKDAGLVAQVVELAKAGVRIGVGTDAFHSNLLEAARFAACLQRVRIGNAGVCPAEEVLYWATRGGAMALGLEEIGALEPGKKADLVVINAKELNMLSVKDPYKAVLYYAEPSNIQLVMVNGKIVVQNGKILTVDFEEVKRRFAEAVQLLHSKIK